MKAAVHTRYGPPDVVAIEEVAIPTIADDEVLVRVSATTVNRTDCGFRSAKPILVRLFTGVKGPRATILGGEFAGVVEAVGAGVTSFHLGDRVFGYRGFGAHAQYLSMRADGRMATIPAAMTFEQAAAGTEGSQYALSFVETAKVRAGQHVLVYGATGAIGSAAVQLLKSVGASVTAVCDSSNVDLVRSLGADRVVDYTVSDFTLDAQVYDAVFDAVGKSTFGRCLPVLGSRSGMAESRISAGHTVVGRQKSQVSDAADAWSRHGRPHAPADGVGPVHAGHRSDVRVRPDRRGVSLCGDGAQSRQRHHQHAIAKPTGVTPDGEVD
jgi:NADPH:quinone reductase-like Zn-dependent oxidoreductase